MSQGFLSRLFTRIFAGSLVRAAYAGVLGREPDEAGLRAHTLRVRRSGRLGPVLQEMVLSQEAQARSWKFGAEGLARDIHAALQSGTPQPGELAALTRQVADPATLRAAIEGQALTPAHWQKLLRNDANGLVAAAFDALLRRQPDDAELTQARAKLAAGWEMRDLLRDLAESAEHQSQVLWRAGALTAAEARERSSTEMLRSAYVGILGREPDAEGRLAYSEALRQGGDPAAVLEEIARSEEAWSQAVLSRGSSAALADPESIVTSTFQGLLGRDPEPQAREAYVSSLRETGDLAAFIAEVGRSPEHRKRVLLRRD